MKIGNMRRGIQLLLLLAAASPLRAQTAFTWDQIRQKFKAANPTLQAGEIGIAESRAMEITAYLRPNPGLTTTFDQITPFPNGQVTSASGEKPYRPLASSLPLISTSYLVERQHKRGLRLESAQKATGIAVSQQADLERNLLFSLRGAFNQALQAKAVLKLTRENLEYYDKVLAISRERFRVGDIAAIDLDRLELQRVQYESDVQTAEINLRTAKIQLLTLLNDRTPIEQFDIDGPFDFNERLRPLAELRQIALEERPDLKASLQSIDKAKTDNRLAWANGSWDPTFSVDVGRNPPIPAYFGLSMTIPVRIFDRNQGEKERTALEIRRTERLRQANEAQVFSDVDSGYATLNSTVILLRPYRAKYLTQAVRVRETVLFAYQRGGAALVDFLQAQQDYRTVQLAYLNLVAAYLNAAAQLNLALGREVIQ